MVTITATREHAVRGNARLTNEVVTPQPLDTSFEVSRTRLMLAQNTKLPHILKQANARFICENIHGSPPQVIAALEVKFPGIKPTKKLPALTRISSYDEITDFEQESRILDRLAHNTRNNIDIVERKYMQQFNVQSGLFENLYSRCTPYFDEKFLVKLIEDIIYFIDLSCEKVKGKSRTHTIVRAATIFLKLRFNESLFHLIKDKAIPFITKIFGDFEVQSGDFISSARELLNTYKSINESPIMVKLYKCTMYIMSLSIFEKIGISLETLGYTSLEKAAMKKKFYKKSDFLYVLFDTALFIAERGYQVYITRDPMSLFHSGGEYKTIFDTCLKIKRWNLLLSNPEEHGFTESEFRLEVDMVIEKLENIAKHSFRLDKTDVGMIKAELNNMLMIRDDMNTKSAARKNRRAPFGILIYGDSGIGKTSVTAILAHYYAKKMGLPLGPTTTYTRNSADPFWSGYTSSVHTCVLDDVANSNPDLKNADSVNEIIQIMNNQAFCPNQAALEDKGRTPFRAKLVIATTNVKHMNTWSFFECPSAVQRRFPFIITPRVREQYKDERGMLNSSMLAGLDLGPYPDIWLFNIELVRPSPLVLGKRFATMEIIKEDLNLKQLLIWYRGAIDVFNLDQTRVETSLDNMRACEFCICCNLPETLCERLQVQSSVSNENFLYLTLLLTFIWYCIVKVHRSRLFIDTVYLYRLYITYKNNKFRALELTYNYYENISNVENWKAMGQRMQIRLSHPKALLGLAGILGTSFTLYKIATRFSVDPQSGESDEVGVKPKAELNGRENVWYNNTLDLSVANFTRESSSSKSMEFTEFCQKISKNVAYIEILRPQTESTYIRARMICLGGHIWMTNNHNIPLLTTSTTIKVVVDGKLGLSGNMSFVLSEQDVHRIPMKDLIFLTLRELPPMKKIAQYFQKGNSNGVFNGAYISKFSDGKTDINTTKKITVCKERKFKFPKYNIDSSLALFKNYPNVNTAAGYCGSVLAISSSYGYSLVGLHFLADNDTPSESYANAVDGDFINEIYKSLSSFNIESGDFTLISSESAQRAVTDLHRKSVFRYLNGGKAHIYGSFTDFRGKSKSSVVNTPMYPFLKDHGYKIKYTKPEMSSWHPWHIAAKDLVKPICTLDTGILNKCIESYISDVMGKINLQNIGDMLMPLDNFTAINGAHNVAYIDKINRNTSAGNPWKKSKKYFSVSIPEEHGMLDPIKVDDEIMNRVDDIIATYKSGKQAHPNFCAHLKDEPVTFKKAQVGKTRVFTGAPFDWSIVNRKYLLSFSRLQQNERCAFESAPGTVAQSLEWQELYEYITVHGTDRIVAGDYKAFDKKMTPKEILAAFDIIIHFCELSGNYTSEDITVIRGIAEDTAFAVVDYNGDLVQLLGSNPSGHPLTVVVNGLVNSLRMRYAFFTLAPSGFTGGFKENVSLMTYGDDNIMSVRKNCDWYNHTAISSKFASLDIIYTMADKEAKSVPFINIDDASFLKRTWRYDPEIGCLTAPLDHDSIEKMLVTGCKSKAVCPEAQGISVITTALREYFYYGEKIYVEKLALLQNIVTKLGWELFVEDSTFLSFAELKVLFKISSKRCKSYKRVFEATDEESIFLSDIHGGDFSVQSDVCYFDNTTGFENVLEQTRFIHGIIPLDLIILELFTRFWTFIFLQGYMRMKHFTPFNALCTLVLVQHWYLFITYWIHLIALLYVLLQSKICVRAFLSLRR